MMETTKQNLVPQLKICFQCRYKFVAYNGFYCVVNGNVENNFATSEKTFAWYFANLVAPNKWFQIPENCPYVLEHTVSS